MISPQPRAVDSGVNLIPVRTRPLIQSRKSGITWFQILLDQVAVVLLLFFHVWMKGLPSETDPEYRILAVLTVLLMAMVYQANGVYRFGSSLIDKLANLTKSWAMVMVMVVIIGFVTKSSATFSREVIIIWFATGLLAQCANYLAVSALQSRVRDRSTPSLVIGARQLGEHLVTHINGNKWFPDEIVGVIEDSDTQRRLWKHKDTPILGTVDEIAEVIERHDIKRVYIALPMQQSQLVEPLYVNLVASNLDVIWAPDIFGVNLLNHSLWEIGGVPLISLNETPLIGSSAFTKSVMDYAIASAALIAAAPIMAITALCIKLTSPGPILFEQKRHGWNGEIITVYKFRSMKLHEENTEKYAQATKDDARVTWIGRIIRQTSIDELPQLFNVIKGTMSIVGPRPHPVLMNEFYEKRIADYMSRHRIKPGLTGLAQVSGYRGETQTLESMVGRVQHDLTYINNWSPWLDLQIMFRTVFVLLGKQAY